MKILYDDLTEVISKCRYGPDEIKNNDGNYKFFSDVRDIFCTLMDEDSYYLLRFYYWLDLTFEHENRYRIAHHKMRPYWNWEQISDALRAERSEFEKLGTEPTTEQYEAMYDKAKMTINGKITGKDNAEASKA
jgi:hypothetical protein